MNARNFDLLNQVVEKIWDCESCLGTFEVFRDEGFSLTDELFREFRKELAALRALCNGLIGAVCRQWIASGGV